MDRQAVESSNIRAVGYDPSRRALQVEFKSGGTYEYAEVAPEDHQAFVNSPSLGAHFHTNVRGKYQHRKLEPEPVAQG